MTWRFRMALLKLQAERDRVNREITGVEQALTVLSGTGRAQKAAPATRRTPRCRPMSAKARKVFRQRMKAYWAKRRRAVAKGKPKAEA